jgi:hypothetical protein
VNYIDEVAADIGYERGIKWPGAEQQRMLRFYAVLCLAKGEKVCAKDVHDAWAAWWTEAQASSTGRGATMEVTPWHEAASADHHVYVTDKYVAAIHRVAQRLKEKGDGS